MKTTQLGLIATRKAARRGFTTYELAGTTQLLAAKAEGWLRRDKRYRDPTYKITPKGRKALVEHAAATAKPSGAAAARTRARVK